MYRNKLTPEEALREIKLRMNYDSKKTLNENLMMLNEVDISGDIRDLKDEINSFNSDEDAIIKILQNYKTKADFDKLAAAYKEKYGADIGRAIYTAIDNYNDKDTQPKLQDWAKSIGITLQSVPTGDRSGTFMWNLTTGGTSAPAAAPAATTSAAKSAAAPAKDKTNTGNTAGTVNNVQAPADLDVKKFQDWLDSTKGAWAFSRRRNAYYKVEGKPENGYGKFGPSTQKMWNDAEVKKEYQKFLGTGNKTEVDTEAGQESVMGMSADEILKQY